MNFTKKLFRLVASTAFATVILIASASALCNGTTTATGLNMRVQPEGEVIGQIEQNDTFAILENHNEWYRIAYRGATGYVSAEFVEWAEDGDANLGIGTVSGTSINVRTAPTTSSSAITQLSNKAIEVTGTKEGWYAVKINGGTGYIHPDYIAFAASFTESIAEISNSTVDKLLSFAANYLGTPYVYGGSTPSGFDCSGFTSYVYRNALGISIPRTSREQSKTFAKISSISNLQPGDLVFFGSGSVGHVGIYVGDGSFIHSPHTGSVVKYDSMYGHYANRFMWGGRVL